jgi:hypothetical protein
MSDDEIYFVSVIEEHESIGPGLWFFDDTWNLVGETGQHPDGKWWLEGLPELAHRPAAELPESFDTLEAVKTFVAAHFGWPIRDVTPDEIPGPDDL